MFLAAIGSLNGPGADGERALYSSDMHTSSWHRALWRAALAALALTLTACSPWRGTPQQGAQDAPAIENRAAGTAQAAPPVSLRMFRVDAAQSRLHLLVYRAGPMARLGHNHVISAPHLQGRMWQGLTVAEAGFEMTVPVNDLVVDDNAARAAEGPDFPLNLSEDAKAGTKANMLRPSLLDGAQYPHIHIRGRAIQGPLAAPTVLAAIRIKDQTREIPVAVTVQTTAAGLEVQGQFILRQTDFGITPLSIAMGALAVQDEVTVKFRLVASPEPGPSGP